MLSFRRHTPCSTALARTAAFKPHIVWQTVIFVALMFGLQLLSAIPLAVAGIVTGESIPAYCWLYATIAVSAGFILYARFVERRPLRSLGFTRKGAASYVEGFATGIAMLAAAVGICCACGSLHFDGVSAHVSVGILAVWLVGFMFQGMEEEIALRGFFLTGASTRIPTIAAVVLNSVVFAVLHIFNSGVSATAIFNLTLFGVFASLYFLRTDNIWGIGALHSAWNFAQGNLFGIPVSGMGSEVSVLRFSPAGSRMINGGEFGLEGGLAVTAVLAAATLLVVFLPYRKKETSRCGDSSL